MAAGCAPSEPPASCPDDLPAACPATAPSYKTEVAPLIDKLCLRCHSPGGVTYYKPLDSYQAVSSRKQSVLSRIYGCAMPPPEVTQPTEAERVTMLTWLVCGAPEN